MLIAFLYILCHLSNILTTVTYALALHISLRCSWRRTRMQSMTVLSPWSVSVHGVYTDCTTQAPFILLKKMFAHDNMAVAGMTLLEAC